MNRRSEATSSPPAARDLPTGRGTEDQHVVNVSSTRAADTPARLPRLALPQITPPAWDEPTVSEGTRAKNTSVVALLIYSRRAGKRSKKRGTCFATCARHAQGVRAGLSSRRHDEMSFDFFNQNTGSRSSPQAGAPPNHSPCLGRADCVRGNTCEKHERRCSSDLFETCGQTFEEKGNLLRDVRAPRTRCARGVVEPSPRRDVIRLL